MEAIEAILTRRSIRKYKDDPVPDESIEKLLRIAMSAPSAHNQQPWHFVVIQDRAKLDAIPEFHPYSKMLLQAPAALCVCFDQYLEKEPGADFWIQDCAAATENILIAAAALGLGTCWLGVHPRDELKEQVKALLHLPDHIIPFSLIALGYPAETKDQPDRFRQDRIHYDQW